MKSIFFVIICAVAWSFAGYTANTLHATETGTDSVQAKLLIVNAFDVSAIKGRKNKRELFSDLADSLQQVLAHELRAQYEMEVVVLPGLFSTPDNDSIIASLLTAHAAAKIIIIRDIEMYFDQTHVDVTGPKKDKTRTAHYNICSRIRYDLFGKLGRLDTSSKTYCEYHSQRNVVSGLLAAGPNIVANKSDAFKILIKNVDEYMRGLGSNMIYQ